MLEFDSISVSSYEAASLASQLTEKSAAGWDVVSIVSAGTSVTAYLSRPAEDRDDADGDTDGDTAAATEGAPDTDAGFGLGGIAGATSGATAGIGSDHAGSSATADDSGAIEVPAIDEPAVDTPSLPSEPSTAWQSEQTTPESTPAQPSLADDLAALASQIEDEPADSAPTEEASGWAVSGSETGTSMGGYEPMVPETTAAPAAATETAQPAAQAAEPAAQPQQAAAANAAPAGWYADPSTRFELRYWDGSQWTEHVSRAGQQYTDPPVA